jgi:hypothetical protein
MTMTTTDPYADTFDAYWRAGWRGVLPLPYRRKKTPPDGYTGRGYTEPSYADCTAWADSGPQNIALHLPRGVVGIDVDDYADKGGGATLQQLVAECGPLPPTWLSTSRGDGISGIRLFRVPDDIELIGALTGIEIIQFSHRYVVCWPSIHPETGGTYEWIDEATGETGGTVPPVESLPALPDAWIVRLVRTSAAADKADVSTAEVAAFFAGLPDGTPCQHMVAAAGLSMRDKSRHEAYNDAVLAVLARGRAGCPGATATLKRLKKSFTAEITTGDTARATAAEAAGEWQRSVLGAVALAVAERPEQGAGCPDDYLAGLILAETADADDPADDEADGRELAYRQAVARKAGELQLLDDARDVLAQRKAGQAAPLEAHSLAAFLAQPDEQVAYRIDKLWPINGRVLLAAAAKAGKTTMVMNLLKALADGGTFLGCYDVQQVDDGTIVYLNMEVSATQMRRWMRRAGIVNADRIHVANLRGQISAVTLATQAGRDRVSEWLRSVNARVVVLDPLAPLLGALGLEEKENSDIARFFAWWSETLYDAGVTDDFICHHAGWDGTRSRGASRLVDEPDAVWTINRDKATDEDGDDVYENNEPRFLKAVGRDVDLPESELRFDGVTGELTLGDGNRKALRMAFTRRKADARVLAAIDAGNRSKRSIVKAGGNSGENTEALDRLVGEGVLWVEKVGAAHLYARVSPVSPSVTKGLESVSVPPLYKGDTTYTAICEDCGGDTGSRGFKICTGCEKRRRQP